MKNYNLKSGKPIIKHFNEHYDWKDEVESINTDLINEMNSLLDSCDEFEYINFKNGMN